ncbi:zinc finger BED domain-containing protein RICESLEEPER 2-like [Nicotiana tabacum]|uniref:Zinc finger BED domain-containing protein RICESLEEPER 2-like n=1 Tax=Nicotiana tabacum TaxID=4097 RepID=A0AC58U5A5_TOBAC
MAEIQGKIGENGGSNETITTSEVDSVLSNKRKGMKERFVVWEHFQKLVDGPNRVTIVKYKYCDFTKEDFNIKNGTLGLKGHMSRCVKFPYNVETNQRLIGFQPISGGKNDVGMPVSWKFDQELCRRDLAKMIILDEQPFSHVEKEGFKNFVSALCPQFRVLSRHTVTRDCFELYGEEKQKLKKFFKETKQRESLKEVGDSVKHVRQAVRYIRQYPARWKKFKECCEIEKIACKKSLCLDVPTRWNSTYLMLNMAKEFEHAFASYDALDHGLLHYLLTHVCEYGKSVGSLVSSDWESVRLMVKFFETFFVLTLKISGSLYVTSNVHFVEICELHYNLKSLIAEDNVDLSSMARKMKEKFDKYWGTPEKMIFIACLLDPRHKFKYVTYALVSMFGEETGKNIVGEVKNYMTSLFDEYAKKHSKNDHTLSSTSSSSSETSSASSHGTQSKTSKATFFTTIQEAQS